MPFSSQDLLLGIILPAVVALVVTSAIAFPSRHGNFRSITDALAVVLGFLAGYWLLELGPVFPEVDREWLPYSAVFALAPLMIPRQSPRRLTLQLLALSIVIVVAAWLLVPTWESLQPSRNVHLVGWSVYAYLLSAGMFLIARCEPDTDRAEVCTSESASRLYLFLMIATLAAASGFLLLSGSLRFCQTTAAAMAALSGFAIAFWFLPNPPSLAGVSLVYALLISASMLTGKVNSFSSIPTVSYLLLPLTPLACGLAIPGRSEKLTWKRILSVLAVAVTIGGLAVGLALATELGGDREY